jgi:hypothetical protein
MMISVSKTLQWHKFIRNSSMANEVLMLALGKSAINLLEDFPNASAKTLLRHAGISDESVHWNNITDQQHVTEKKLLAWQRI